jgi:predicted ATPase
LYVFKHALVQDAAYGTLLRGTRQELHARIAWILEERFPEAAEAAPERVAQHYTAAGLAEPAVRHWSKAGQRAIARSAIAEALAHLRRGLDLLSGLPDTDRRRRQELELQVALGVALMAAQGWSAPEAGRANARARELCEQIGVTAQLWPVLYGQWVFHGVRAEHDTARGLADELLRRAEKHRDAAAIVVGLRDRRLLARRAGGGPRASGAGGRSLRPGAASIARLPLRPGPTGGGAVRALVGAVRARLPGAGAGAKP